MQAIELETLIDKNGHIYLPKEFQDAYGKFVRLVILLPEQAEGQKKDGNPEVQKESLRCCLKTMNTLLISMNTYHESLTEHAGTPLVYPGRQPIEPKGTGKYR